MAYHIPVMERHVLQSIFILIAFMNEFRFLLATQMAVNRVLPTEFHYYSPLEGHDNNTPRHATVWFRVTSDQSGLKGI
jgi:hypothetical protein